ncbi:esterase/lipase family protein [Cryptosporangium sp. NPDC051539]|uniref:esterase/lipase family protein n=1 Tax=Cryptosporangium sp. NPDC051539 TaxID=3363962 RepID=UPI0037953458
MHPASPHPASPHPTVRPLVLVRGFGGTDVSDEQRNAYQGFNEGTVYPNKRGENYIYEGFLLRALKSVRYPYTDATNVIGYYAGDVDGADDGTDWSPDELCGTIVVDPQTAARTLAGGVDGTIWVYRFYDLSPRSLDVYGRGLTRLISLIRGIAVRRGEPFRGVDILAHSMGGLVVRAGLRELHRTAPGSAAEAVHRIVTLGTPHRGIAFQRAPRWLLTLLPRVEHAADEIAAFDPRSTAFTEVATWFPIRRILTVVGTNHRTYGVTPAALANELTTFLDGGRPGSNRSDGLVAQASAQLPGAPRTFVHKCHGGPDSLVTSREAYEIAMRFFHATHAVRLWLDEAEVRRGGSWFGHSEYYFGVSIKPRYVDFELFHQSSEAENCYGPFVQPDFSDDLADLATELSGPLASRRDRTTGWAGPDRLIWEGWMDEGHRPGDRADDLVFRLDVYVGERDRIGCGFSDNVVFRKQYYVQVLPGDPLELYVHTGEQYLAPRSAPDRAGLEALAAGPDPGVQPAAAAGAGQWRFPIGGSGFEATLRVAIDADGRP